MIWKGNTSFRRERTIIRKPTIHNVINVSRKNNGRLEKLIFLRSLGDWWLHINDDGRIVIRRVNRNEVIKTWKSFDGSVTVEVGNPQEIDLLKLQLGVTNKIRL